MKNFKFIELPKEEVIKETELSFLEGAFNCNNFNQCTSPLGGKSYCGAYNSGGVCNSCGGGLYCIAYSF